MQPKLPSDFIPLRPQLFELSASDEAMSSGLMSVPGNGQVLPAAGVADRKDGGQGCPGPEGKDWASQAEVGASIDNHSV